MMGNRSSCVILFASLLSFIANGCGSASESLGNTDVENTTRVESSVSPRVRCSIDSLSPDSFRITYEIYNSLQDTIHVMGGKNLPYQLARNTNTLVILHGIHAFEPNRLPHIVEIPVTRPL